MLQYHVKTFLVIFKERFYKDKFSRSFIYLEIFLEKENAKILFKELLKKDKKILYKSLIKSQEISRYNFWILTFNKRNFEQKKI